MGTSPAVRARGIGKSFGGVVALDGVDLDVPAGQVHGLVGPNGAGKTTLLGLLLGLSVPDTGSLELLGAAAGRRRGAPAGVAGFVNGPGLYPSLTARRNLTALAALRGCGAGGVSDALDRVGLGDVADDRVRGFSLGMRQRLGLAAALLTEPRLLVLDEPANGLDPAGKAHLHRVIAGLAADGTAVVLSSHHMDDLAALCSEVTVLLTGRVVFSGPVAGLAAGNGALDHRLRTSDPVTALRIATGTVGLRVLPGESAPAARPRDARRPRAGARAGRAGCPTGAGGGGGAGAGAGRGAPRGRLPGPDRRARRVNGVRFEFVKLLSQWRVRLVLAACWVAPGVFVAAVSGQGSLPVDTIFGRWMNATGWADSLVVLAFACTWALPLLTSLVAGDVFAAEDRLGTWPHLLVAVGRRAGSSSRRPSPARRSILALAIP